MQKAESEEEFQRLLAEHDRLTDADGKSRLVPRTLKQFHTLGVVGTLRLSWGRNPGRSLVFSGGSSSRIIAVCNLGIRSRSASLIGRIAIQR